MSSHLKSRTVLSAAAVLSIMTVAMPAYAVQNPAMNSAASATIHPSVIVFDQKPVNSAVKLTYVYVPAKSFAVVYGSDQKGKESSEAIGSVAIEAGDHRDLKIPLTGEAKPGAKLWISLNEAKGGNTFDQKNDVAYWASGDLPAANSFIVR